LRHGSDYESGCNWVTWTRPGAEADKFHFYGEVKQITMIGTIRQDAPVEPREGVPRVASSASYRYMFEHGKDLANHIWAVAVHHPDRKTTVAADGRPTSLPWEVNSLHEASGNAMGIGKKIWSEELKPKVGAFEKFDLHYGLARYALVPLSAGLTLASNRPDLDTTNLVQQRQVNEVPQIRIERMEVQIKGSMLAQFAPADAIMYDRPFQPLHPSRERAPRLPRVESELQALFNDAGELVDVEEEEGEEDVLHLPGAPVAPYNVRSLGRIPNETLHSNPQQVYDWDAGPYTPNPVTRAPSPPPVPAARKRFSANIGSGLADITKKLRRQTIAMHTRRRVDSPTVDHRGSPIERTNRPELTSAPTEPVLRLDTPGRVSMPNDLIQSPSLTFLFLFFRHIGCSRNSHVDSNGFQGHEDVTFFSRLSGLLSSFLWNGMFMSAFFFVLALLFPRMGGSSSVFPFFLTPIPVSNR